MSFPDTELPIHVQALLLGEWVDFGPMTSGSGDFYTDEYTEEYIGRTAWDLRRLPSQEIAITRGRSDETSENDPGSCKVTLWNPDGYLTPGDPRSPWFQTDGTGWGLNTQMRILVGDNVRFHGEISEIVPEWPQGDISTSAEAEWDDEDVEWDDDDVTWGVADPGHALVHVTISGILRRLSQRTKPLRSALHRKVTAPTNLSHIVDYWPMEDGKDSGFFASGLPSSVGALPRVQHSGWTLASDDTLWGSQALPTVGSGGDASWLVTLDPTRRAMTTGDAWVVEWNVKIPAPPTAAETRVTMEVNSNGGVWVVTIGMGDDNPYVRLRVTDSTGTVLVDSTTDDPENLFIDDWVTFRLYATAAGGNVNWGITWSPITPGVDAVEGGGASFVGSVGAPVRMRFTVAGAPAQGVAAGQVIVHDGLPGGWLIPADVGWQGETAAGRASRIASEEGISFGNVYGPAGSGLTSSATSRKMGTQESLPVLDLLREAAATENGVLVESRVALALRLLNRGNLYNRTVRLELDARDKSQIANPFAPYTDDQTRANDVTASKIDGSEFRKVDETAVEVYDQSLSFSIYNDHSVKHYAGWYYHLGTHEGARFPQVTMDLVVCGDTLTTGGLTLLEAWTTTVNLQSRIQVINLPPQHPSYPVVDLIIQGYTETLAAHGWTVELNCSPAAPWDVDLWGVSRYTGKDSVLSGAIGEGDTTFDVYTPGIGWATSGVFPFDLLIGPEISPERVTVTDIDGAPPTQEFTVIRGVAGYQRAHAAGSPVRAVVGVLAL